MKKSIILTLFLTSALFTFGQNYGEIHGKITSIETEEAIPYTVVTVTDGMNESVMQTDFDGKFKIKGLQPGTYSLHARATEFQDLSVEGVIVLPDDITFLNDLALSGIHLPPIDIVEYVNPLVRPSNPGIIAIMGPDLEQSANRNNTIATIAQLPAISVGPDGKELYFRGARPQSINTYIDGVRIIGSNVPRVPSNAVKSINVYTGGVPASFGDITGGVILINTKSYMDFYNASKNNN